MKKILSAYILFFMLAAMQENLTAQTMNISYKTITGEDKDEHYIINAVIPQVDFGPEALMGVRGIAEDINTSLDTIAEGMIQKFKNSVSELTNKTAMNGMGSSLDIKSAANVVSGTLLSVRINEFSSVIGMAHPVTTFHSFNYSTVTDKFLLSISDLFKEDSDYLKYISDLCIADLRENAIKNGYTGIDDMIKSGAGPDLKNFSVWNITDNTLIITFNPSQTAPYVFGVQTVHIPLFYMTEMINPKGPLSFMYR